MSSGPDPGDVRRFLSDRHGEAVDDLEVLSGGFWSAAYGDRAGGRQLVLRVGQLREGFESDRDAMAYAGPDLPVPEVIEIGDAFGGAYAISVRHYGRFLEDVEPAEADVAGATIVRLLTALKGVPSKPERLGWRGWLLDLLVDDPSQHVSGWRTKLAADPEIDELYPSAGCCSAAPTTVRGP